MNCKVCGKPLREGMEFCWFCGAPVESNKIDEVVETITSEQEETVDQEVYNSTTDVKEKEIVIDEVPNPKKSSLVSLFKDTFSFVKYNFNKKYQLIGYILVGAIIITLLLMGGYLLFFHNKNVLYQNFNQATINTVNNTYHFLIPDDFVMTSQTSYAKFIYQDSYFEVIPYETTPYNDLVTTIKKLVNDQKARCLEYNDECNIEGTELTDTFTNKEFKGYYLNQGYKAINGDNNKIIYVGYLILSNNEKMILININYYKDNQEVFNELINHRNDIISSLEVLQENNKNNVYDVDMSPNNLTTLLNLVTDR